VSGTGTEERGRLSDPHQIAVRAIYKIPPRTNSAPNTSSRILLITRLPGFAVAPISTCVNARGALKVLRGTAGGYPASLTKQDAAGLEIPCPPGSVCLKLGSEIPVGFECAMGAPQICDSGRQARRFTLTGPLQLAKDGGGPALSPPKRVSGLASPRWSIMAG
jgi:hypothetical protein